MVVSHMAEKNSSCDYYKESMCSNFAQRTENKMNNNNISMNQDMI